MSHFQSLWHRSPAFKITLTLATGLSILLVSLAFWPKRTTFPPQSQAALARSQFSVPAAQVAEDANQREGAASSVISNAVTDGKKAANEPQTTRATSANSFEDSKRNTPLITAPQQNPDQPAGSTQPSTGNNAAKNVAPVPANPSIAPPAGVDASQTLMGKTLSGQLSIQGRSVPLPEDAWIVVAHFPASAPGSVESLFLAQLRGNKLAGGVVVQVSRLPEQQMNGFRQSAQCMRAALLFVRVMSNEDFGNQDCWTINHNHFGESRQRDSAAILQAAAGELEVRGVALPLLMLSVFYRLADKQSFLNAVYYFNPEVEGITSSPTPVWEESDWHQRYIRKYPEKVAYVQRLRDWSQGWHARVRDAFASASKPQDTQSLAIPK